jgi:hypothetical protein
MTRHRFRFGPDGWCAPTGAMSTADEMLRSALATTPAVLLQP